MSLRRSMALTIYLIHQPNSMNALPCRTSALVVESFVNEFICQVLKDIESK
jgi:hypothetical protein